MESIEGESASTSTTCGKYAKQPYLITFLVQIEDITLIDIGFIHHPTLIFPYLGFWSHSFDITIEYCIIRRQSGHA